MVTSFIFIWVHIAFLAPNSIPGIENTLDLCDACSYSATP